VLASKSAPEVASRVARLDSPAIARDIHHKELAWLCLDAAWACQCNIKRFSGLARLHFTSLPCATEVKD